MTKKQNSGVMRVSKYFIALVAVSLFLPGASFAYIDPNTGGFFFTSVLPFVYGALAALVIFWKRIANSVKNFFSRSKDGSDG